MPLDILHLAAHCHNVPVTFTLNRMKQPGAFPGERVFLLMFVVAALIPGWLLGRTFRSGEWLAGYCIGLALIAYGVAVLRRVHVARRWPCAIATVVASRVDDVRVPVESGDGLEYRPLVVYDYPTTGGRRRSDRFCVVNDGYRSPDRAIAQTLAYEYKPGVTTQVHICPMNSGWSVLRPDLLPRRRSHTWASIMGGAIVIAISIWSGWAYAV